MEGFFSRFGQLSAIGLAVIVTAPLGMILCHAVVSVAFGEERVEVDGQATTLGKLLILVPLLVGAALIAIDIWPGDVAGSLGGGSTVAILALVVGILFIAIGIYSLFGGTDGDANIGAGILVLVGLVMAVTSAWVLRGQ